MKSILPFIILAALTLTSCNNSEKKEVEDNTKSICSDDCHAKGKTENLTCNLTTPELQRRKETVLASLKAQVKEKKELQNGYAFKFDGSDKVIDELTDFIKTERQCCDFFVFNLSISGDRSEAWLELTGVKGVKDVITNELGL